VKSQNNYFFLIISLSIATLGLIVAGFFYFQNQKVNQQTPVIQEMQTVTPELTESNNLTFDWKTYTHKDYGYSIKFPRGYALDDRFYPYIHITKINNTGRTPDPSLDDINLFLWDPPSDCNTDNACFVILNTTYIGAKNAGSNSELNPIIFKISGKTVKGIEAWNPWVRDGGTVIPSKLVYDYPMSFNGKLFEITLSIDGYETKNQALTQKNLVDKILSTFRFRE
jgi:hypothetical protein